MRTYILKYKYDNLVHILLLALNAAIFVSASVTLALMTNQLVSKRIQSFLALNYIIAVHQTKLIQKMTLSIRQSYLSKIIHHSFSEFRKSDIGEHLSVLNTGIITAIFSCLVL